MPGSLPALLNQRGAGRRRARAMTFHHEPQQLSQGSLLAQSRAGVVCRIFPGGNERSTRHHERLGRGNLDKKSDGPSQESVRQQRHGKRLAMSTLESHDCGVT